MVMTYFGLSRNGIYRFKLLPKCTVFLQKRNFFHRDLMDPAKKFCLNMRNRIHLFSLALGIARNRTHWIDLTSLFQRWLYSKLYIDLYYKLSDYTYEARAEIPRAELSCHHSIECLHNTADMSIIYIYKLRRKKILSGALTLLHYPVFKGNQTFIIKKIEKVTIEYWRG